MGGLQYLFVLFTEGGDFIRGGVQYNFCLTCLQEGVYSITSV